MSDEVYFVDDDNNLVDPKKVADPVEPLENNSNPAEIEQGSNLAPDNRDDDHDEDPEHGVGQDDDTPDSDPEREAIRQRRRDERKQRNLNRKEKEERLRRELEARDTIINQLRQEVDAIKHRNTNSEVAQLNNATRDAQNAYAYFKEQIRVATEANNGAAVAEATEKMMLAKQRIDQLVNIQRGFQQRQAQPQPLDPRLAQNAATWMQQHSWYAPGSQDLDSQMVMTLDQALAREGWDPTTPQYWQELTARVKKYLPHRATSGNNLGTRERRNIVAGSGRESATPSKGVYQISADRVKAMKDAGIWDDPKQRADAIKRFREYDKANPAN